MYIIKIPFGKVDTYLVDCGARGLKLSYLPDEAIVLFTKDEAKAALRMIGNPEQAKIMMFTNSKVLKEV